MPASPTCMCALARLISSINGVHAPTLRFDSINLRNTWFQFYATLEIQLRNCALVLRNAYLIVLTIRSIRTKRISGSNFPTQLSSLRNYVVLAGGSHRHWQCHCQSLHSRFGCVGRHWWISKSYLISRVNRRMREGLINRCGGRSPCTYR